LREALKRAALPNHSQIWIVSRQPLVDAQVRADAGRSNSCSHHARLLAIPQSETTTRGVLWTPVWITSRPNRAPKCNACATPPTRCLTGIGTVLIDNPLLTDRTGLPRLSQTVASGDGIRSLRLTAEIATRAVRQITTCSSSLARAKIRPKHGRCAAAELKSFTVAGRDGKPDLRAVIAELGRREMLSVLFESGLEIKFCLRSQPELWIRCVYSWRPKIAGFQGIAAAKNGFRQAPCELHNVTEWRSLWRRFRSRGIFCTMVYPDSLSTLARLKSLEHSESSSPRSEKRRALRLNRAHAIRVNAGPPRRRPPQKSGSIAVNGCCPHGRRNLRRTTFGRRSLRRNAATHQPRRNEARHARQSRTPA